MLPAVADDGLTGFENIMDQANEVLGELVVDHTITAEERERMVLRAYPRQKSSLLAPFASDGCFQHLSVEDFEMSALPDAAWNEYQRDGDEDVLVTKHARFFRSVFMPSLASALDRVRSGDADALRSFGDRLEDGLKRRLASQPMAMHSFVQSIVFAKES